MELNVGDKIRVRRDLKVDRLYGANVTNETMMKYKNQIVTVKSIDKSDGQFHIEEDGGQYYWTKEMVCKPRKRKEKDILVKVKDNTDIEEELYGKIGFKKYDKSGSLVCEFIEKISGGHCGNGTGIDGYCWYLNERNLETYNPLKIKITSLRNYRGTYDKDELWFKEQKIEPLFRKCFQSYGFQFDTTKESEFIWENEDTTIVRQNNKYYRFKKSGLTTEEETKVSDNTLKEIKESIKSLSEKVEERDPFQKAMTEAIIEKGKDIATKDLEERLKNNLDKFIEEKYGVLPKVIKIQKEEKERNVTGLFHKDFGTICKIVESNVPLMLVGGAGAGKNHTLEQVAEALELDFYTTNAINQDYKLTGFIDANGKYHETEFYKAFTKGGMFFLDEIDASCPEAIIILNGAIANKYFDFPNGRVTAHKDFRVVCAGNTYGTGADMVYVGRNVLDGATLDRFIVLPFDYDEEVEKALAYDMDLYNFIRDLRKAINDSGLRYIVSMRALINATKLLEIGIDQETILKTAIIKNMQIDDLNTIIKKLKHSNSWTESLKKMSDIDD